MNVVAPWLVVFDLDGTLIDSSRDLCLAVNAAMAKVGVPALPHELITSYVGDGAAMLVRRALGDPNDLDSPPASGAQQQRFDEAYRFFLEFYSQHKLDNTRPYPEVLSSLEAIRKERPQLPMAVLTNKPVRPSREICDALGLSRFFFRNYGGNSFATKKPDPQGLFTLMNEARSMWERLGAAPDSLQANHVLMVGDSEADVLTARRAGARSLGCQYGLSPHSLELAEPDYICSNPVAWPDLLRAIASN